MGVEVLICDIDIVYRVFFWDIFCMGLKLIVCKFICRLVRNEVMLKRKEGRFVDLFIIGFYEGIDMFNVFFLDYFIFCL